MSSRLVGVWRRFIEASRHHWAAHQRVLDLSLLWPSCCELAPTLDHAKAAFAVHCFNDGSWMIMGERWVCDFIDRLEPPAYIVAGK